MNTLHFIRPYAFYALIPLLPLLWFWWRAHRKGDNWQGVCDPHLLKYLLVGQSTRKNLSSWLFAIAWTISVIALSGPAWDKQPQPVFRAEKAVVILLDVGVSMLANDVTPSRMQRAKFKILDILNQLKEGQVALIAYTSEPFLVSPLTQDAKTIAGLVPVLSPEMMPVLGSDLTKALKLAGELLQQASLQNGNILIVTDSAPDLAAQQEAEKLQTQGFDSSVLAVGTEQGGPIPLPQGGFLTHADGAIQLSKLSPEPMQQLAKIGGGRFLELTADNQDVDSFLQQMRRQDDHFMHSEETDLKGDLWQDNGQWLLILILPILLLCFRRSTP